MLNYIFEIANFDTDMLESIAILRKATACINTHDTQ